MSNVKEVTRVIQNALPRFKGGSLRIWGHWFGRPYDNIHVPVVCEVDGEVLRVRFNEGEMLTVWSPLGALVDEGTFRIGEAARVRWEWFYYGRPKTSENLYFEDFVLENGRVSATTNTDWYTPDFHDADAARPAVEIAR
jgi:hypothetical protein